MDGVFTVGQYNLVSIALRTFRVPLDEGVEGFPGSVGPVFDDRDRFPDLPLSAPFGPPNDVRAYRSPAGATQPNRKEQIEFPSIPLASNQNALRARGFCTRAETQRVAISA